MKKITTLLLVIAMLLSLVACQAETTTTTEIEQGATEDNTVIRLMALMGPTGMGLAELYHNDVAGTGNRADYDIELITSSEISNIAAALAKKECDIAAVPINLASTIYAKTNGNVQVLCANTLGVLHLLENGNSIQSIADLRGKTIYATGKASTPEYILRYVLEENGLDPEQDVTIQFVADHTELATMLAAEQYAIGMLPEPNVSVVLTQNPSFRVALDMTQEWNKVAGEGNTLIQGVYVARKDFVEAHPTLIEDFLADYDKSQKTINNDPKKGAGYIVEAGILAVAPIAEKAIPGCNITMIRDAEMKRAVSSCLKVLFDAAPSSVGGALPPDAFYYIGK